MDTCYVDTETTSLIDPHLDDGRRVWEIALIRLPEDGSDALCAWLQITDVDLTHANPDSLEIGRFEQRFTPHVYGPIGPEETPPWRRPPARPVALWGCTEGAAAQTIAELTDRAVIAGSNPAFDMASMADLMRRHGAEPTWWYHPHDVPDRAAGWLRGRTTAGGDTGDLPPAAWKHDWTGPSYSTHILSEACGIPEPAERHSAWVDARWMLQWDARLAGVDTMADA